MTTPRLVTLKKRRDFLALRHSPSIGKKAFLLVREPRSSGKVSLGKLKVPNSQIPGQSVFSHLPGGPQIGFTVTKKLGNAVRRNRIKRRLKSAFQSLLPLHADDQADYVLIARAGAFHQSFDALKKDMSEALTSLREGRHKASQPHKRKMR